MGQTHNHPITVWPQCLIQCFYLCPAKILLVIIIGQQGDQASQSKGNEP